jgi:hypothetical protein
MISPRRQPSPSLTISTPNRPLPFPPASNAGHSVGHIIPYGGNAVVQHGTSQARARGGRERFTRTLRRNHTELRSQARQLHQPRPRESQTEHLGIPRRSSCHHCPLLLLLREELGTLSWGRENVLLWLALEWLRVVDVWGMASGRIAACGIGLLYNRQVAAFRG